MINLICVCTRGLRGRSQQVQWMLHATRGCRAEHCRGPCEHRGCLSDEAKLCLPLGWHGVCPVEANQVPPASVKVCQSRSSCSGKVGVAWREKATYLEILLDTSDLNRLRRIKDKVPREVEIGTEPVCSIGAVLLGIGRLHGVQ